MSKSKIEVLRTYGSVEDALSKEIRHHLPGFYTFTRSSNFRMTHPIDDLYRIVYEGILEQVSEIENEQSCV